jgi:hypothetical protein
MVRFGLVDYINRPSHNRNGTESGPSMELLVIAMIVFLLAVFAVSASEYGVDSRDASDDPHRPSYPVGIS